MSRDQLKARFTLSPSDLVDRFGLFTIACVMSLAFLFFDLILPLGVAGGVGHIAVVLLGLWFPSRKQVIAIAMFAIALIFGGFFLSPEGGIFWKVLVNKGLAIFAVISTGTVIYYSKIDAERKPNSPIIYKKGFFLLACALSIACLTADIFLPLGIASGVSYVSVILFGRWFYARNQIAIITMASIILTILGYVLSPEDGELWKAIFNRVLAIFAITSTGAVIFFSRDAIDKERSYSEHRRSSENPANNILNVGVFAQADDSYDSIGLAGFRGLLAGFPVLLLILGVTFWINKEQEKSILLVSHTHEVRRSLASVLSILKDAETGQRSFLLTGETNYLESYVNAVKQLKGSIRELRRLTLDNPGQQSPSG